MAQETWKPIPGYGGDYEVSDLGRVRSHKRGTRILKPQPVGSGYRFVSLSRSGQRKQMLLHRLVLRVFVGPPLPGMQAAHLNHDRTDNRLCNLKWDTPKGNVRQSRRAGRLGRKLTNDDARDMHRRRRDGESLKQIAEAHDVTVAMVSHVCLGRRWPHIAAEFGVRAA